MGNETKTASDASLTSLVSGIIGDAQNLMTQHFTLLRREVQAELRQAKSAAITMVIGGVVVAVGVILLLVMVVHLLHDPDLAGLPLWASYAIVGGVLTAAGVGFLVFGKREAGDVHLAPPPQTAEAVREDLAWLKNQTTSTPR